MATLQIEQLIGREDAKRRLDLGMVREALVMLFFVYSLYISHLLVGNMMIVT